jgi:hypothetical protein
MIFNSTYVFSIPEFKDDERNQVTAVIDSIPAGKLYFAKIIDNKFIEFTPNKWSYFKDYDLQIKLIDGNMQSLPYKFKLKMTNSAP